MVAALPIDPAGAARPSAVARRPAMLATLPLCAGILGVALVLASAQPGALLAQDPELAHLLRGMALLKGAMVAGAVALLGWRLRWPVSVPRAIGYSVCVWALAAATAMIWQLAHIAVAAAVFHGALLAILWLAWRDDLPRARFSALQPVACQPVPAATAQPPALASSARPAARALADARAPAADVALESLN